VSESPSAPSRPGPRPSRIRRWLPLAYLPVSVLFLAEAALTGKAYLLRDVVTFFHPWQQAVRTAVLSGSFPFWNHQSFCGVPLMANLQSGVFYPVNWLYWALPFDLALTFGMVAHLTVAGAGMRGFLRRAGLAEASAFLGGALFAYGTWAIAHLEFPMQLGAAVWLPFVWSGVWSAMRGGDARGVAGGAAALAMSLLAGYPQVTMFGLMSASLLALFLLPGALRARGGGRARALAWPLIVVLAALTAGAQLLPSREMAAMSVKAEPYPADAAMSRSLPPLGLVSLVDPYFLGLPGVDRYWGGEITEFAFGTFYVGAMAVLLFVGAGPALFRPKRRRRVRREDFALPVEETVVEPVVTWFLLAGTAAGALIALGRHTPIYPLLHEWLPGFDRTRWPGAAGFLIAVHAAGLAAIGFRAVTRDRDRIRSAAIQALALGGVMLAAWALASGPLEPLFRAVQTAGVPPWQEAAYNTGRGEWLGALMARAALLLATGVIGLLLVDIRSRVAVAWSVLLLIDLFLTARWFHMPVARGFYDEVPAEVAELAGELDGRRVLVSGSTSQLGNFLYGARNVTAFEWAKRSLLCNANMPAGIAAVDGCEPLGPRRHEAFVQAFHAETTPWEIKERIFDLWDAGMWISAPSVRPVDVPAIEDPGQGIERNAHDPRLARAMLLGGWRTLEDGTEVLDALFSRSHDPAWRTLLEAPPGGAPPAELEGSTDGPGEKLESEAGPNSIQVSWQIGKPGMLRILESWDPGWRATVNGRPAPIYRADFLFLAVPVPAGPCDVRLTYRPPGFTEGAGASLLGIVGLAVCFLAGRHARTGSEEPPAPRPRGGPGAGTAARPRSSAEIRRPEPELIEAGGR
jgi:hypothetical protein